MQVSNVSNNTHLLSCKNLQVTIAGKTICNDLSINFNKGEVWGILGRNGAGKTSLLHTLAGLRAAQSGDVFIQQQNIRHMSRKTIAQQLGILLQHNNDGFPCSVLESTLVGRHPHIGHWQWESADDKKIALEALAQVEMEDLALRSTEQLSGGEQQRVAIAALISQAPDVFLLDEPDSHLDLHYQIKLLNDFQQLAQEQNKLIIMCIHDINLAARFCDNFLMLYGNGEYIIGHKDEVLTIENLQIIYQHPFNTMSADNKTIFIPT